MQIPIRLIIFVGLLYTVIVHSRGKILRVGYKYFARFTLIDGNSRLTLKDATTVAEKVSLIKCTYECMREKNCKSINHNEIEEKCELLERTKFDDPRALKRDKNWKHYETNDDVNNIGEICEKLSPCQPHKVCEATYQHPPFICRCRDGFEGEKCEIYKGRGYEINNPAVSCGILFGKFKDVPDGLYWINGLNAKVNCTRRVDGGYSRWSDYGPCSTTCGHGVQIKNRTCKEPAPKGGGRSCERLGENTMTKSCHLAYCSCLTALQNGVTTLKLTFNGLNEKVKCGMFENHAVTYFSHNAETVYRFDMSIKEKSREIDYINTIEFVKKAVKSFTNCKQRFHVRSFDQHAEYSYFENLKDEKLNVDNLDCIGCMEVFENQYVLREGWGHIMNKRYLPLKSMTFKDTDESREFVEIKPDKLMCW